MKAENRFLSSLVVMAIYMYIVLSGRLPEDIIGIALTVVVSIYTSWNVNRLILDK